MEDHGVVVDLLDGLQARCDQIVELREVAVCALIEGIRLVHHPLKAEHHIIGVEIPRWFEQSIGLPFHAMAEMEGVGQPVG